MCSRLGEEVSGGGRGRGVCQQFPDESDSPPLLMYLKCTCKTTMDCGHSLCVYMYVCVSDNIFYFFRQVEVLVVTTEHASHFYDIAEIPVRVYTDKDEWEVCKRGALQ